MSPARHGLMAEVGRFLVVGAGAFLVEVCLSNALVFGLFGLFPPVLADAPVLARAIATVAAVAVAWIGNRMFTYGHRDTGSPVREVALFVLVNVIAMGIVVIPLGIAWYGLGLQDPVSFNISTNVIGTALAMAFRFVAYRRWVFKDRRPEFAELERAEVAVVVSGVVSPAAEGER